MHAPTQQAQSPRPAAAAAEAGNSTTLCPFLLASLKAHKVEEPAGKHVLSTNVQFNDSPTVAV